MYLQLSSLPKFALSKLVLLHKTIHCEAAKKDANKRKFSETLTSFQMGWAQYCITACSEECSLASNKRKFSETLTSFQITLEKQRLTHTCVNGCSETGQSCGESKINTAASRSVHTPPLKSLQMRFSHLIYCYIFSGLKHFLTK